MMETFIIILISLAIIFLSFFIIKWSPKKSYKDTKGRHVSVETDAEVGTDKLIRHLEEKENAEHNAELMANSNVHSTIFSKPVQSHAHSHENITSENNSS